MLGFKRIPKISTPIRLSDDGEVECMATLTKNGELECLWGRSSRSLTKKELDQYSGLSCIMIFYVTFSLFFLNNNKNDFEK